MTRRLATAFLGVPPQRIALIAAAGIVIGVFPMVWCPTLLCLGIALLFRISPAPLLAINQLTTPLQFALMVPFARTGAWVLHAAPAGKAQAMVTLANAMAGWALLAIPMGAALYVLFARLPHLVREA